MTHRLFLFLMLVVLIGSGCVQRDIPQGNPVPEQTFQEQTQTEPSPIRQTITGQVIYADTRMPVPGATVVTGYMTGDGTTTITDTNGRFSLSPLMGTEKALIYVAPTGIIAGEETVEAVPGEDMTLTVVQLGEKKALYADAKYVPSTTGGVRIIVRESTSGVIQKDMPITFEKTVIQNCSSGRTDETGTYTCSTLSPGVYRVYVPFESTRNHPSDLYQFSVVDGYETQFEFLYARN